GPSRCRSRQLYATFSFPPTNHFACGGVHSRTVCHGSNQPSSLSHSAQYASGSDAARAHISGSRAFSASRNDGGGGNRRSSSSNATSSRSLTDISASREGFARTFRHDNRAPERPATVDSIGGNGLWYTTTARHRDCSTGVT